MTAFTPYGGRFVRVHGTKGYLEAKIDEREISYWEFWEGGKKTTVEVPEVKGGHGGADDTVMRQLIGAIESGDESLILTGTEESLRTHRVVFAAERARREGRVVGIKE